MQRRWDGSLKVARLDNRKEHGQVTGVQTPLNISQRFPRLEQHELN